MDTDSLFLALVEKELEDCIRPEMRTDWQRLRSNDCVDSLIADAVVNSFLRSSRVKHKQHDKRAWPLQRRVQMYGDVISVQ